MTNHLLPYFGDRNLRELTEDDVLRYIGVKLDEGYATKSIENHLAVLRRMLSLLVKKGVLPSNAAADIKALMARVRRGTDEQTRQIDAWSVGTRFPSAPRPSSAFGRTRMASTSAGICEPSKRV